MRLIILFLILVPAAEIGILLWSGKTFGFFPTVFLIILTGIAGAYLAKREGLQAIRRVQEQVGHGRMPADSIVDGICILVGGVLLLTPGFITDTLGFLMLLPPTRVLFKRLLFKLFRKWADNRTITIIR